MTRKKFVYIRFCIASLFLVALIASYFLRKQGIITTQDISIYGSFIISLYAIIYGIENLFEKDFNLGVFLIAFGLIISVLNIYMIRNVIK
ncbi:MAG TPA: hypothetical protein VJ962_12225 [Clostridia bacterium]|nr:hypothetical protein [Clostridia bacterium]